jgi:pilus assembly protein Flp/PilA
LCLVLAVTISYTLSARRRLDLRFGGLHELQSGPGTDIDGGEVAPMLGRLHDLMVASVGSEDGATAIEYALMIGLIALVVIGAVALLGTTLSDFFSSVPGRF